MHIVSKELSGYQYDKYYIGITSTSPEKRWGNNGIRYKCNSYFTNAINKYGWDNIEHKIVATCLTHEEACEMEKELIKKFKSNDKIYGYNLTDGGEGVTGYKFTEEQHQKLLNRPNSFQGKRHSEETKQKMKENHACVVGSKNGRAKPVYVFDLNGVYINTYPSTVEAAEDLGIKNWIATSASHKTSCYGYLFAREKDIIIKDANIFLKNINEYRIANNTRKHKNRGEIVHLDKNFNILSVYENTTIAHLKTGVSVSTMIYQADNKNPTKTGSTWRWESDILQITNKPQ